MKTNLKKLRKEKDMQGREITKHTLSQNDLILDYLKSHKMISQYEATQLFGCYRLSARIDDLRRKGNRIKTIRAKGKNQLGHTVNFAQYVLEQE